MAFPINTLPSLTMRYIMPRITDNVFDSNPLIARQIKKAKEFDATDETIRFPIILTKNPNVTAYNILDPLPVTVTENSTAGEMAVARYNAAVSLPGSHVIHNMGVNQVINILKAEFYNAEKALKDQLGTDLFSNNSVAPKITGLQVAIDDATNYSTYAGISRSAYPTWKAQYFNAAAGAFSLTQAYSLYYNASIDETYPTLVVFPRSGVVKLWGLLQPQQRFTAEDMWVVGPRNLALGNAPVFADSHIASTKAFFINENYLELWINSGRNFAFVPFQQPYNMDMMVGHIRVYLQEICTSPRLQAQYDNVNFSL